MPISESDRRVLLALIWALKPSDLSVLSACVGEAKDASIGTVRDSANDQFFSQLEKMGLAKEQKSFFSFIRALRNAKAFALNGENKAELKALIDAASNGGDPPGESVVTPEAVEILKKSAADNDPVAQRKLGLLYERGNGVGRIYSEAMAWYQKAAALGDPVANNNIGLMIFAGHGVQRDLAIAMKWFLRAAELGSPGAMDNLGEMYARGLGVTQDNAEALSWFRKAADHGHEAARRKAEELASKLG
jgi:TPR repeat protein